MSKLLSLPLPKAPMLWKRWRPLHGAAHALALTETARISGRVIVAATRDSASAHALEADLQALIEPGVPVLHFPDWETLPYDLFAPHPDIVSQRIATLYRLPSVTRGVLVVPVSTLMQRLPPTRYIADRVLMLKRGDRLDLEREATRLERAGYRRVGQVIEPGDFAVRGSLLDLYPAGSQVPYRIELLDDEIDTLRAFDPETQRSAGAVDKIELLPAREFPFDEPDQKRVREAIRERFDLDVRRSALYQDLKNGNAPSGIEYYLPLFFDATATLFDYLPKDSLLVLEDSALEAAEHFFAATGERWNQRSHDVERPILPPAELYLPPSDLRGELNRRERVLIGGFEDANDTGSLPAPSLPVLRKGEEPATELKAFLNAYPGRVLLAADSPGRREALLELLTASNLRPQVLDSWEAFRAGDARWAVAVATLSDGFALSDPALTVLTERQLYGERARQERRRRKSERDPESIIRDLGELVEGAPVVHIDHGVGRYRGLVTLDIGGAPGEFLTIEYAGNDKLYVPVSGLELISRYTGGAPEHAPLHSLGSDAWDKAKKRAAEKVRDVAAELLELYAKRRARIAEPITIDRGLYEQFAAGFPFEETPDQLAAIEAVLADLVKKEPMDRVVCGDVGFGKTEVALRAAFVAAQAGRQVAVLVPTTLLAEQHYRNFADRFADWPIRVEVLSRFKTPKEIKAALDELAKGTVDVMVGTHRLIQEDVRFKQLGLVIVDEEQRFGVRQKEQLKKLRAEVDLLTLTATPIPRTLNMALTGLRDLSIIATPPQHRLAVKTFIAQWDPQLLREAFERELGRGGQVYFLHNEVETIEKTAREVEELIPQARIRVAHGQMAERELEVAMLDFYRQRFNVLVCTTIIESGIDVPTANTIIINRADRFGLSQLHQLRGRVGRSHHRAFAYLIVPHKKSITQDAQKRLDALASLEELGAGFTLSTHDLEIRGAGELLGEGQSGEIESVGFTLYTEMLERAVRALKEGRLPDDPLAALEQAVEIQLGIPALIPEDYLPDVHARLVLYKRISSARDDEALNELQVEMIDRFGLLPDPAKHLFIIAKMKLRAQALGIRKLELGPAGGRVIFKAKTTVDPMNLIRLVQRDPKRYAFEGQDKLKLKREMALPEERVRMANELLGALGGRG
ncbi:MAG: transcription-repair coupling factor [Rhodanobacteraceae bacterium]|nr:transcription-repair coupling factor [Rhodanobacteraceae bacterium]